MFASFLFEFSICIILHVQKKINKNLHNGEKQPKCQLTISKMEVYTKRTEVDKTEIFKMSGGENFE